VRKREKEGKALLLTIFPSSIPWAAGRNRDPDSPGPWLFRLAKKNPTPAQTLVKKRKKGKRGKEERALGPSFLRGTGRETVVYPWEREKKDPFPPRGGKGGRRKEASQKVSLLAEDAGGALAVPKEERKKKAGVKAGLVVDLSPREEKGTWGIAREKKKKPAKRAKKPGPIAQFCRKEEEIDLALTRRKEKDRPGGAP